MEENRELTTVEGVNEVTEVEDVTEDVGNGSAAAILIGMTALSVVGLGLGAKLIYDKAIKPLIKRHKDKKSAEQDDYDSDFEDAYDDFDEESEK